MSNPTESNLNNSLPHHTEQIKSIKARVQRRYPESVGGTSPYSQAFAIFDRFFGLQYAATKLGMENHGVFSYQAYGEAQGQEIVIEFGNQVSMKLNTNGSIEIFGSYNGEQRPLFSDYPSIYDSYTLRPYQPQSRKNVNALIQTISDYYTQLSMYINQQQNSFRRDVDKPVFPTKKLMALRFKNDPTSYHVQ